MIPILSLLISIFIISPLHTNDNFTSNNSNTIHLNFSKNCLPQLNGSHTLSWEEKINTYITKKEMILSFIPPNPNGYSINLPTNPHLKEFTLQIKLSNGEDLKCKIDPSKNIKIDRAETYVILRTKQCNCIQ